MKKIFLAAALFVASFANAQTADEIIAKHLEARGGAEKLKAVKTMKQETTMAFMGMEANSTTTIVNGRAFKQELEIMGQKIVTAIDGDKGWMINPMGGGSEATDIPSEAVNAAKSQADISGGLLNIKESGSTVELAGTEKIKDSDAHKIKITSKAGVTVMHFIDSKSFQIVQTIASVMGAEAVMKFSDFKTVDGITFPFVMEMENPQAGTIISTTKKVELNQPVDDAVFKKPN